MDGLCPALILSSQGEYEEAERIHREALVLRELVLGTEHPDTLTSMSHLALVQGEHSNAFVAMLQARRKI